MNIFQEALISAWFIVKLAFFGLTLVGAKVVWDKFSHLVPSLTVEEEDEDDEAWLKEMYG